MKLVLNETFRAMNQAVALNYIKAVHHKSSNLLYSFLCGYLAQQKLSQQFLREHFTKKKNILPLFISIHVISVILFWTTQKSVFVFWVVFF